MAITIFHIIIPPIIFIVSVGVIIVIFRRAHWRNGRMVSVADAPIQPQRVRKDGSVTVPMSISDTIIAESDVNEQKRGSVKEESSDEQIAEREKMLIKRIAHDPRDAEAYNLLGQVYLVQNNVRDAAECFEQVIELDPKNVRAINQLKKISKIQQDQTE